MRRFAIALTGSRDIADDIVQDACARALSNPESFAQGTRFDAWMFQIIRNLWIDRLRRRKTAGPTVDVDERDDLVGEPGEASAIARISFQEVAAAIGQLPDEQREVLVLVCIEDFSYKDAADVIGVPIGTVMSRLARARKRLVELSGINPDGRRLPNQSGRIP